MTIEPLTPKPIPKRIARLQKEFARLCQLTSYQRINERAAATKADKWLAYQPLKPEQLHDTLEDSDMVTVLVQRRGEDIVGGRSGRAAHANRLDTFEVHQRIVRRPTEMRAIAHALGFLTLDSDFVVIRQDSAKEERWCILCQTHHSTTQFVSSKRYINGLSFACRRSLQERSLRYRRMAS